MKQIVALTLFVTAACATPVAKVDDDLPLQAQRMAQLERRISEVESRLNMTTAQDWVPYFDEDLERYLTCVEQRKTIECVDNGLAVKKANARKTLTLLADAPKGEIAKILLTYEYLNNYGLGDPKLQTYLTFKTLHSSGRCFSREASAPKRSVVPTLDPGVLGVIHTRVEQLDEEEVTEDVVLPEDFLSKRRPLGKILKEIASISDHQTEHAYNASAFNIACIEGDDQHMVTKVQVEEISTGVTSYLFEYRERRKLGEAPAQSRRGR